LPISNVARALQSRALRDTLAGIASQSASERVAAQFAICDVPLTELLYNPVIPYEQDDVTRLIVDSHDAGAFAPISHLTVGGFRDWLLAAESAELCRCGPASPRKWQRQ